MNKIKILTLFSVFTAMLWTTNISLAQTAPASASNDNTTTEVNNSTTDAENVSVDDFLKNLPPLEEVQLQEPRLSTGSNGELQAYLSRGSSAPWAGVLLNPEAVAYIIAEYEASYARAAAALNLQRQADWSRMKLELGRLYIRLNSQAKQYKLQIQNLREENQRLTEIHENYVQQQNGGFWNTDFGQVIKYGLIVIGSVAVGILVGAVGVSL